MDDSLQFMMKLGICVGIAWMISAMYCLLMIGVAMRSGVRLLAAWYQDWFDSVFEEEPEAVGERTRAAEGRGQAVRSPEPAAAAPPEREQVGAGEDNFTGAGTPPRVRSGFVRRSHS